MQTANLVLDWYGPLLSKVLFPAFEAARGRPTVPLTEYLHETQWWSHARLQDLQAGFLRRLVRHAYAHTAYYREVMDARGVKPFDIESVDDIAKLPVLDRDTTRSTIDARTTDAPPHWVIRKQTSGSTGQPSVVRYNAESRHWRDATRWRGYGWGGYRLGMRALHYWGHTPPSSSRITRTKIAIDHALKRDIYMDCTPRGDAALMNVVETIRRKKPSVIVAYAAGAAALARFINAKNLRDWDDIPTLVGAERLWPAEREQMERAFGPAFETYGCREVMLIGAECEAHDGMHASMENLVVELLVREPDGGYRAARPGEVGEVAITDLHNLACPMIRYLNGDAAVAQDQTPCACGRGLGKLGPIEGRVTETLRDGNGAAVSGLVFNVLFGALQDIARKFQIVQRVDGSVVMKLVPTQARVPEDQVAMIHAFAEKYLPGAPFAIEHVDDIPLTGAGKRKVVVVETA
ncbi:phenylacetate--CoA ligase family protein [soil metagenome]